MGDREAAAALCDTSFWFGENGGADVVRAAVDAVTGTPGKETGRLGQGYYEKFRQLTQTADTKRTLLDSLAKQRADRANGLSLNGEIDQARIEHFRFR